MTTQTYLNKYFCDEWKSDIPKYKYSGHSLINQVNSHEWVLDVGCGDNYFKEFIPNLVGIDPANESADYKLTIEEFEPQIKFDVAFCLGSINFGSRPQILQQVGKVVSLLEQRSRIYWRCNPGLQDHNTDGCKQIEFFPWTFDLHYEIADMFGYRVKELRWDTDNRIYAEWVRV